MPDDPRDPEMTPTESDDLETKRPVFEDSMLDFTIGDEDEEAPAAADADEITLVEAREIETDDDEETEILPRPDLTAPVDDIVEPGEFHEPITEEQLIGSGFDDEPSENLASAAPPRIVSETPLAGVPRFSARPMVPEPPAPFESSAPSADAPAEPVVEADESAEPVGDPLIMSPESIEPPVAAGEPVMTEPAPPWHEQPEVENMPSSLDIEIPPVPPPTVALDDIEPQRPAVVEAPAPTPARPAERTVAPPEPPDKASMKEWDEDVSPELAAILFRSSGPTPTAPPPPPPAAPPVTAVPVVPVGEEAVTPSRGTQVPPVPTEAPAAAPATPIPTGPAQPIFLTDVNQTRRLPITAQAVNSPPPEATLAGKGRYVRLEEPTERGQHIVETWEYLKTAYPPLEGRLVKSVRIEEMVYSDGSWAWRYERHYTDGGFDLRRVRASADRQYIERHDELKKRDPSTGKMRKLVEGAALIFAPPIREEKRGLFGGRRHVVDAAAPKSWRTALTNEIKAARKASGMAF